jgi:hypothetical protein
LLCRCTPRNDGKWIPARVGMTKRRSGEIAASAARRPLRNDPYLRQEFCDDFFVILDGFFGVGDFYVLVGFVAQRGITGAEDYYR